MVAEEGAVILNAPAASVEVPFFVPFTKTEAPLIGLPFSSLTLPVTGMIMERGGLCIHIYGQEKTYIYKEVSITF